MMCAMWLSACVPADWLSVCHEEGTQVQFCQFGGGGFAHNVEEVSPHACGSVHICAQRSAGCTLAREALLPQLRLSQGSPSHCWVGLALLGRKRNLEDKDLWPAGAQVPGRLALPPPWASQRGSPGAASFGGQHFIWRGSQGQAVRPCVTEAAALR